MKRCTFCTIFICILLSLSMMLTTGCSGNGDESERIERDTLSVLTTKVRQCSRLYSAEYRVRKIVTHDDAVRLQGSLFSRQFSINLPFSKRQIAIPVDATLKGCIDFSEFGADNVVRHGKTIEIILPDPQIVLTSSRIDHKKVKQYVALLRSDFSDEELTRFAQEGRKSILEDIAKTDIIERTRHNAARLLIPMIMQLGFEEQHITVTYRKDFDPQQVKTITKSVEAGR